MTEQKPLPADDPKWPPLQIRNVVLHSIKERALIAWVEHLGGTVGDKEAAIEYILRHEFGDPAIDEFIGRLREAQEAHELRRREAHQREKEALKKYEAAYGRTSVDLEADAKEKREAQRSGPPASPLAFRGPLVEKEK